MADAVKEARNAHHIAKVFSTPIINGCEVANKPCFQFVEESFRSLICVFIQREAIRLPSLRERDIQQIENQFGIACV